MAQIPHSVLQQVYMYSIQKQNIQSSFLGPPLLGGGGGWLPCPFVYRVPFGFGKGEKAPVVPGVPGKLVTPGDGTPYGDVDRAGGDLIPVAGVGGSGRYAGLGLPELDPVGACVEDKGKNAGLGLPGLDPVGIPASPSPTIPLPAVGTPEAGGGGAFPNRCGVYGVCGV